MQVSLPLLKMARCIVVVNDGTLRAVCFRAGREGDTISNLSRPFSLLFFISVAIATAIDANSHSCLLRKNILF